MSLQTNQVPIDPIVVQDTQNRALFYQLGDPEIEHDQLSRSYDWVMVGKGILDQGLLLSKYAS